MEVSSGTASDRGKVRPRNEDVALVDPPLYAVADGMGGHAGGSEAAHLAIQILKGAFEREPSTAGLMRAVGDANYAVWQAGTLDSELAGMGTTLVALARVRSPENTTPAGTPPPPATPAGTRTTPPNATPAESSAEALVAVNVGDSRLYRYHDGYMVQISQDHSVVEELVRRGELTKVQAELHPRRHMLTRVLGMAPEIPLDAWEIPLVPGDRFVLCSDGLSNELSDDTIAAILESDLDAQATAGELVGLAKDHGGNDNITVVVVDIRDRDPEPEQADGERGWPNLPGTPVAGPAAGRTDTTGTAGPALRSALGGGAERLSNPYVASGMSTVGSDTGATEPSGTAVVTLQAASSSDITGLHQRQRTRQPNGSQQTPAPPDRPDLQESSALAYPVGTGNAAPGRTDRPDRKPGRIGYAVKLSNMARHAVPPVAAWVGRPKAAGAAATEDELAPNGSMAISAPHGDRDYRAWKRQARRRSLRSGFRIGLSALRITIFLAIIGALAAGGYIFIRWYANDSYYVILQQGSIRIFQGRQGGVLGFEPHQVRNTGLTGNDVAGYRIATLKAGVVEPDLAAADGYVRSLEAEKSSFGASPAATSPSAPTKPHPATTTPPATSARPRALGPGRVPERRGEPGQFGEPGP